MDDTREADGSTLDVQRSTFNVQHPEPDGRPTRAMVWIATGWIDAEVLDAEAKRIYEEIAVPAGMCSGAFAGAEQIYQTIAVPGDRASCRAFVQSLAGTWECLTEPKRDVWRSVAREVLPLRYRMDEILSTLPEILAKLVALEKLVIERCDKAAKP